MKNYVSFRPGLLGQPWAQSSSLSVPVEQVKEFHFVRYPVSCISMTPYIIREPWFLNCAEMPWGAPGNKGGHRIFCTFEGCTAKIHIRWPSHELPAPSNSISASAHDTPHLMSSYLSRARFLAFAMLKNKLYGNINVSRKEGCCVQSSPRLNMLHSGQQVCRPLESDCAYLRAKSVVLLSIYLYYFFKWQLNC